MPEPDVSLLAKSWYQLSLPADGAGPAWELLPEEEREEIVSEARQWLVAAAQVGLAPAPGPGPDEWGRPRRVLDRHSYDGVHAVIGHVGERHHLGLPDAARTDLIDSVLHQVGVLPPPPNPAPDRCPSMYPWDDGSWVQCTRPPHDPDEWHEHGEGHW